MSVTSAPFFREPPAMRGVRFIALLVLAIVVALLSGLLLLSLFPTLHQAVEQLIGWQPGARDSRVAGWLAVAFVVLVPIALLWALWRFRLRSWWWVGGGWLVVTPVLVYLASDDAMVRHTLSVDEIAPAFPGAEKSFAVFMRYGKNRPEAKAFRPPYNSKWAGADPDKPGPYREFLVENRATLEADWAALAPQRAWWAELNAFDRIGDLTPPRADAEIISFQVVRALSQRACTFASLQALDGRGDDAIDTLLPILQVGRKLQPSSRTLVRSMIGIVLERLAMRTAVWVLDTTPVSPAARARLASALQGGAGETGARRLVSIDFLGVQHEMLNRPIGDLASLADKPTLFRHPLNLISPIVYNRRASANLYGDLLADLRELAARRETTRMGPRNDEFFQREGRPRFKNFAGAIMVQQAFPSMTKVVEAYWKTEDMRLSLRARLAN
jgi:hypothetical protein